jgi:hypothetical protein
MLRATTIHLFGNPDVPDDALAPALRPELEVRFPGLVFRITDPNELDLPRPSEDFLAIDVVAGLERVRDITLDEIAEASARATTHDFDLASFLLLARKLRPEARIRIIGIPLGMKNEEALAGLDPILRSL